MKRVEALVSAAVPYPAAPARTHARSKGRGRRNPWPFLQRLALFTVLLALCVITIAHTNGAGRIAAQFVTGMVLAHGTELAHQLIHGATGDPAHDRLLGYLLSWTTGGSFGHYRFVHLTHHGSVENSAESFEYSEEGEGSSRVIRILGLVRRLSMVDYFLATGKRMAMACTGKLQETLIRATPKMPPAVARRIEREYQWMVAIYSAAIGTSLLLHTAIVFHAWLVPVLFWAPIHSLIEMPEHWGANRSNPDVSANTRTVIGSAFAIWLTNGNGYHVEHHRSPGVPIEQLGALHKALVASGYAYRHLDASYPRFYLRVLKAVWNGPADKEISS